MIISKKSQIQRAQISLKIFELEDVTVIESDEVIEGSGNISKTVKIKGAGAGQ